MVKHKMSKGIRKLAIVCLTLLIFVPVLSACGMFGGTAKNEEPRVLRIATMYGDSYSNDQIRTEFTDLFQIDRKYIDIEIVSAVDWSSRRYMHYNSSSSEQEPEPRELMKDLLEGPNPVDIVLLESYTDFAYFTNENLLVSLDSYIKKDDFDIDSFAPAIIEGIKAAGNNTLYGLAPRYSSNALIYNKNMFDAEGITHPEDGMTWDQVFDLAARFPKGSKDNLKFGFSFRNYKYNDMIDDLMTYTRPLQLQMFDTSGESMLIDLDPWPSMLGKLVQLYEDGVIPTQDVFYSERGPEWRPGPYDYDAFLSGQVAMTLINHSELRQVISANENAGNISGFEPFEWDVVTFPVHADNPTVGGEINMYPIMAINASAANPDDAWDLIKFVNSKEWAELKSRSTGTLLSRKDYAKPMSGADYNIGAFTQLRPALQNVDDQRLEATIPYLWDVRNIGRMKLDEVIRGDLAIDQAIQEWKTEGDAMLKFIKENPGEHPYNMMSEREMMRRAAGF